MNEDMTLRQAIDYLKVYATWLRVNLSEINHADHQKAAKAIVIVTKEFKNK
jgi:hypothetical protein